MRQVTRKGLITVAAAGGVLALGGGYAQADSGAGGTATGSPGVLSGNNVQVPVHVPVNVCGNTVDVVGVLNPAFGNSCANGSGKRPGGHGSGGAQNNGPGGGHGGGGHGAGPGGGHGAGQSDGYGGGSGDGGGYGGGSHSGGSHPGSTHTPPAGGSHAGGGATHSPGVGSGNSVEVPIEVPVNVCGNSVDLVGLLNPAFGDHCENGSSATPPVTPEQPGKPVTPVKPATPGTPTEVRAVHSAPSTPGTPGTTDTPVTQAVAKPPATTDVLAQTGAGGLGIAIPAGAGLLLAGTILYRRARSAA